MAKMYNDWSVWQSVKNGDEAVYSRLVAECMEYADKKSLHTIEYYEGKGYYLDGMRDDLIQEGRIATLKAEYSGVKSITCPDDGNHHSGEMEITIPEVEIANMLS